VSRGRRTAEPSVLIVSGHRFTIAESDTPLPPLDGPAARAGRPFPLPQVSTREIAAAATGVPEPPGPRDGASPPEALGAGAHPQRPRGVPRRRRGSRPRAQAGPATPESSHPRPGLRPRRPAHGGHRAVSPRSRRTAGLGRRRRAGLSPEFRLGFRAATSGSTCSSCSRDFSLPASCWRSGCSTHASGWRGSGLAGARRLLPALFLVLLAIALFVVINGNFGRPERGPH